MNTIMQNILAARHANWEELIIPIIIFAVIILKKIFSGIKDFADQFSEPKQEEQTPKHYYDKDDFVTLEELRARKLAKIRAAYGIPEPKKQELPIEEAEPELVPEPVEQEPVREQYIAPPPIRRQPPQPPLPPVPPPVQKIEKEKTSENIEHAIHPAYKKPSRHHRESKPAEITKETQDTLIHLKTQQDLRSAILYQEILGKPLALRD